MQVTIEQVRTLKFKFKSFCAGSALTPGFQWSAVRCRSRVMLMMQRLIAVVNTECCASMPSSLGLQLVGVLQVRNCAGPSQQY